MCDENESNDMAADEEEENGDAFDDTLLEINRDRRDEGKASPRRFRNNSYYKAVGSSGKNVFNRCLAVRKKPNDEATRARALLYQQVTERGLDDTMDDDDDASSATSTSPSEDADDDSRPLWSSLPGVRTSGILSTISQKERRRQEAMYELFTSEQSYFRSLNVLLDVFVSSDELRNSTTSTEYHHLFSNLSEVTQCSKTFLADLESRFRSSPDAVVDVCDILNLHINRGNFTPYITYCSSEVYQQRAFQRLIKENRNFAEALKSAQTNPSCMGLPLHSFLLLPMQRVTRIPLLVDMIRQRCDAGTPAYRTASIALRETSKLVKECNERAEALQRTEDMIVLQSQLEFKTRSFALVSQSRFLLKRGPLTRLSDDTILGFKKVTKQDCHVFLFNDVIITAKKKSEDKYTVIDFCYRHRLKVHDTEREENAFQLVMEKNQDGRRVLLRLQAESPSSRARWVTCLMKVTNKDTKIHKGLIQVRVVRPFRSEESDIISLQPMDVLCVLQATIDGWYYGERLVDSRRGWFPSSVAKEIFNLSAREKNFKRGTRMLGIETQI